MNLKELEEARNIDIDEVARETLEKAVKEANEKLLEAVDIANRYEISFSWENPFTQETRIYSGIQQTLEELWVSSSMNC